MSSVVQAFAERVVGTVEEVSAENIVVLLNPEAPQATALNTGAPSQFPRINSYLLVPNEVGATVGWITAVRIERLPYPKQRRLQDLGLVDLPFPSRVVVLTPLGTLTQTRGPSATEAHFEVRRGMDVFPSAGDPVLLPTNDQLQAIVMGEGADSLSRVLIGHSPTAAGAPIYFNPDKLFGRHLAVLGNTGAGKSCSVAGLVRWCIDEANAERERRQRQGFANARFVILDPNGEYARAFDDLGPGVVRVFQAEAPQGDAAKPLEVPAWLWNGEEWAAFTGASPGVQRPILFEALRRLRSPSGSPDPYANKVHGTAIRARYVLRVAVGAGDHQAGGRREGFADSLVTIAEDFEHLAGDPSSDDDSLKAKLRAVAHSAAQLEAHTRSRPNGSGGFWHNTFSEAGIAAVEADIDEVIRETGLSDDALVVGEDAPRYFPVSELPRYVEALASNSTVRDLVQFVDFLNLRIRGLISRGVLGPVLNPEHSASIKLEEWLAGYIGADSASNGQLTIIDLSLVPSEVIQVVVAVLGRLIFEALQRYRRETGKELPTVLVLEEAHTFVHRDLSAQGATPAGRTCSQVFERIAREGRKFGLGLVLASQRPFELSPTVLSQCNTFLLHRIVNDQDQELVRRLVPDGLGSFLRELPSLPSRRAILLGSAAPSPVLVEVRELPEPQRPQSPNPAFWDVWTGDPDRGQRPIDWNAIAARWTGGTGQGDAAAHGSDTRIGEEREEVREE